MRVSNHTVMDCPYCGGRSSHVISSRPRAEGRHRVRVCDDCEDRFETIEVPYPGKGSKLWFRMKAQLYAALAERWEQVYGVDKGMSDQLEQEIRELGQEITNERSRVEKLHGHQVK